MKLHAPALVLLVWALLIVAGCTWVLPQVAALLMATAVSLWR